MKRAILIFFIGAIIGFLGGAHWDVGIDFVQDISPAYNKTLKQGLKNVSKGLQETGQAIKKQVTK